MKGCIRTVEKECQLKLCELEVTASVKMPQMASSIAAAIFIYISMVNLWNVSEIDYLYCEKFPQKFWDIEIIAENNLDDSNLVCTFVMQIPHSQNP